MTLSLEDEKDEEDEVEFEAWEEVRALVDFDTGVASSKPDATIFFPTTPLNSFHLSPIRSVIDCLVLVVVVIVLVEAAKGVTVLFFCGSVVPEAGKGLTDVAVFGTGVDELVLLATNDALIC